MSITANRRLEATRVMLELTRDEIQTLLGCKRVVYGHVIAARTPIPHTWLTILNKSHNINPNWILLGEGHVDDGRLD